MTQVVKAPRGRPIKTNDKFELNGIVAEFLVNKKNDYGSSICYFKLDKDARKRLKPVRLLESDAIRMPYWCTDKKDIILKVKDKFVNTNDELHKGLCYVMDLELLYYSIEQPDKEPINGYYAKAISIKQCGMEIDLTDPKYIDTVEEQSD